LLRATPRHADVITPPDRHPQIRDRIVRIYEQTPDPKFVVAVGACASPAAFYRGATTFTALDQVIPSTPTFRLPVRPDALLNGVVKPETL
jgi:membrane-bound hydrogenase subunit mbhJ